MNRIIKFFATILLLFPGLELFAQATLENKESAALLHQNGQIYLVVLVLVTIFAGIIFFLIKLERKINKLEKNLES